MKRCATWSTVRAPTCTSRSTLPPMARIHGALRPMEGSEPLSAERHREGAPLDRRRKPPNGVRGGGGGRPLIRGPEPGAVSRQRVPAARLRLDRLAARFRTRFAPSTTSGCPSVIRKLAEEPRGIVLLTGTTGSGKSTTLAAMIDQINSTRSRHMVTLEDPIEYLHRDKLSIINQREVGDDTAELRPSDAQGPAPGPGRDPDRRDARRGDRPHRARGRRDRPPRALDPAHPGRLGDDQPDHRLLPAAPPAAGAGDARVDASRCGLAAPGPARRTAAGGSRSAR